MPELVFGLTRQEFLAAQAGSKPIAQGLLMLQYVALASQKGGVTCEECVQALGITTTGISRRFYKLYEAGCLVKTDEKRPTRSGGLAVVHKIAPNANFKDYLAYLQQGRQLKTKGLSLEEQAILAAGKAFLQQWGKNKSRQGKEHAVTSLVKRLLAVKPKGK